MNTERHYFGFSANPLLEVCRAAARCHLKKPRHRPCSRPVVALAKYAWVRERDMQPTYECDQVCAEHLAEFCETWGLEIPDYNRDRSVAA